MKPWPTNWREIRLVLFLAFLYPVAVFLILELILTGINAYDYHSLVSDKTNLNFVSWYDRNWFTQPYTNFRLAFYPHHDFWSKDGAGNDIFECEVTVANGKKFWTILERRNKQTGKVLPIK